MVPTPTANSLEFIPRSSAEFMSYPQAHHHRPLIHPEAMALPVMALLFATRRMMSSGALTCPVRRYISQLVQRLGLWEGANLGLGVNVKKIQVVFPRPHGAERTIFDEHDKDGFAQPADPSYSQGGVSVPGKQGEPDDDRGS